MSYFIKAILAPFALAIMFNSAAAQNYSAWTEATAHAAYGDHLPFWLVSNQYGRYTPELYGVGIRPGIRKEVKSKPLFDYGFGLAYNLQQDQELRNWPEEYYGEIKFWIGRLTVGAKKQRQGNQDSCLSSGGLLWSKNARPIPQAKLSTNGYVDVPLLKGYLEFKASLAHGWMEKDRYVSGAYMHQKSYWLRAGGNLPVQAEFGFYHYALWGGVSSNHGQLSEDFAAFKRIFLVENADEDAKIEGEKINALGNHLGTRNFGLNVNLQQIKLKLYWQTIFEDGSGYAWRNIGDGLYGIKLEFPEQQGVKRLVYEYMRTTDQSGPVHDIGDTLVLGGNDNYFNNYVYQSGWTYYRMTIGNPLITSPRLSGSQRRIQNNALTAHHAGIAGVLFGRFPYRTLITYSQNYGLNLREGASFKEQVSGLLEVRFPLPNKASITSQLAIDQGAYYNNGIGLRILYRKNFQF